MWRWSNGEVCDPSMVYMTSKKMYICACTETCIIEPILPTPLCPGDGVVEVGGRDGRDGG